MEWARAVAPSVAHILHRHFRHEGRAVDDGLGFGAIVLSLLHSGEQYLEDLSERLAEAKPADEVESILRRLSGLGDALSSADGVEPCVADEFMLHYRQALRERAAVLHAWAR
jgi:hypothetical protein